MFAECLRTVPVFPAVQAAVFLCFRVILLRMSGTGSHRFRFFFSFLEDLFVDILVPIDGHLVR